jgi:TolB-like protein
VLNSRALSKSPQSRAFLSYVVTEALEGRAPRLTERTVGRYVMNRSGTFDGRFDATVRVRATRVRQALQKYYAGEGATDRVRISLPVGGYVPRFGVVRFPGGRPEEAVAEASSGEPRIVVTRFDFVGVEPSRLVSISLAEALVHRLTGFPGLQVVGPVPREDSDVGVLDQSSHARFVFGATVVLQAAELTVNARLTDASKGTVVWARSVVSSVEEPAGFSGQEEWASEVAGEIGDWAGIVFRLSLHAGQAVSGSDENAAKLAFYAFLEEGTRESLMDARARLEAAVDSGSRSALVLAMLGNVIAIGIHYSLSEDPARDVLRAEALARAALAEEPESAFALLVLATCDLMEERWDMVSQRAVRAAELCPYHPTTLASAGLLLTYSGAWSEGVELLQRAFRLNPRLPSYARTLLVWDLIVSGDDAGALAHASVIHAPGEAWGPLCRALALAGVGHLEGARAELEAAIEIDPSIRTDMSGFFATNLNLPEKHVDVLASRLSGVLALLEEPADR